MRSLRHLKHHFKIAGSRRKVTVLAFMILFFVIYDGIIMYLAPIVMQNAGVALGTIGLILGLSSVAGMLFDIILLRLLEKTTYRLMFLYMFAVASTVPFFLFGINKITLYLAAMALWGLYYNLYDIGTLDFIGRTTAFDRHISSFGILKVFESLGYLIAPFVGSLILIGLSASHVLPSWLFLFLLLAFVFYLFLCRAKMVANKEIKLTHKGIKSMITELGLWKKVGGTILPLLILTLVINLVDAAIWTIGPLFSESLAIRSGLTGGAFMLAYTLPPLFMGWFIGRLVNNFGKKKIALLSLLVGSLLLVSIGLVTIKFLLIGIIFFVSFFFSLVWPTINGAYADKISDEPTCHEEVETIDDWFTNIGDTAGPIMGGYAAQVFGIKHSFVIIGVFGAIIVMILFKRMPPNLTPKLDK